MRVVPSIFFLCLQSPTNSFTSSIKKATYTMMWNVYHLLQLQLNGLLLGNRSISFSIAMHYVKQWLGHAAPLQKKLWKLKFILQYAEFTYSSYLWKHNGYNMYTLFKKNQAAWYFMSDSGSHVRYSCHHNSSRFTFPIFVHSWRFSVSHSLQSITPHIY
jgi:hypothetical protein